MKKLLYLLLLTPIIYLASCSKSNPTPQSLEDVIVGTEWCLDIDNRDGFLLAEDGKFYLTAKCQPNTPIGNWVIDGDLIKYQFSDSTQEITIVWGEVTEYSESQIKLLDYSDSLITITEVYILDTADIFGCMDVAAANYNPAAECDEQGSCLYIIPGCTDSTACNYNPISNEDDGSCLTVWGCTDILAFNYNSFAQCDDGSCSFILSIGDAYQGGIIFYLDGNGGGLIAAGRDVNISSFLIGAEWGCYGTDIPGAGSDEYWAAEYGTGIAIGTGAQNTIDIINNGCQNHVPHWQRVVAAKLCDDLTLGGYSDWFLPSKDELYEMFWSIPEPQFDNLNFIIPSFYWSSTEVGTSQAWAHSLFDLYWNPRGLDVKIMKFQECNVRAIRAF